MTSIELKAARLEREQVALMEVIAGMIDDVRVLLRYVEVDDMDPRETYSILANQANAIKALDNILQGE